MKFVLTTSANLYDNSRQRKKYAEVGFVFNLSEEKHFIRGRIDSDIKPEIEIDTLEELLNFVEEFGDIIIKENGKEIEIYDSYHE